MENAELERELREGVGHFEQILDVLPEDRMALEFLCVACLRLGDGERFLRHALTLTELVVRENDVEGATNLIGWLASSADTRAKKAVLKLRLLVAPKPELEFERPVDRVTAATPSVAAKAELDLLNRLVAEGVLTKGLVQPAFDQLENPPATGGAFLISALAILEKENLTGAADAVAAVADAALAPPVPLESFEIVPADVRKLPENLVRVRGVVPFARLGEEWAVAVLNPLDEALRDEVTVALGAKCHFFLALPTMVEKVLTGVFGDVAGAVPPVADPLKPPRHRPGFTLIEVLMAAGVLAMIAAGLLATTWRFAGFARDQSERMVADAYCHDVMWAVYCQSYSNIGNIASFPVNVERELPRLVTTDILGREKTVFPLKRRESFRTPTCRVAQEEKLDAETEPPQPYKEIAVTVTWQSVGGIQEWALTNRRPDIAWRGGR